VSWVWSGVPLDVGSVGCVVDDIASGVGRGVFRNISHRVSWSISYNISSRIDRLHYFVFTSSLFSHWLKGTLIVTLLTRTFRSTPGVETCCGPAISRASFFDLGGGDTNVG
jgi:ABC-type maltose transport system permease subunit